MILNKFHPFQTHLNKMSNSFMSAFINEMVSGFTQNMLVTNKYKCLYLSPESEGALLPTALTHSRNLTWRQELCELIPMCADQYEHYTSLKSLKI